MSITPAGRGRSKAATPSIDGETLEGSMVHITFGDLSLLQIIQSLAIIFGLCSAWAWAKSALDQLGPRRPTGWVDHQLNRISQNPVIWNAIAESLAAGTAVLQATVHLMTMPM